MRNQKHTRIISLAAAALAVVLAAGVLHYSANRRGSVEPNEPTASVNALVQSNPIQHNVSPVKSSSSHARAGYHLSKDAAEKMPALPATLSQTQINAVKLPKGFVLAQVPWLRDVSHPVPAFVAQARLPWLQDVNRPVPAFVALASLPWRRDSSQPLPVFVALARLPWADCRVTTLHLPHPPQRWGIPDCKFVMALCRDRQGNMWIATEGSGIFRYDPAVSKDKQWTQFTKQNTQGQLANNNIYALACDNRGRIWAGELNHGISVYNGSHWQNYDIVQNPKRNVLAGPLGNHVFALRFDKYTNQMWACTDAGISIYQCSPSGTVNRHLSPVTFASGTWHYITQANGLPQNPDCLAFTNSGKAYVGTQCGGIAVGMLDRAQSTNNGQQPAPSHKAAGSAGGGISNYDLAAGLPYSAPYSWRLVTGPWKMPLTAFGHGLPSNLINTISAGPNGELVAGTDGGIAFNKPASPAGRPPTSWTFERGQDFPAKVLGLWHPPQHWQSPSPETLESLPMEDYTTAVAYSDQRSPSNDQRHSSSQLLTSNSSAPYLWLAHRTRGIDVWQYSKAGTITNRLQIHEPQIGNYITSLLPLPGGAMAVGTYGHDVSIITLPGAANQWKRSVGGTAPAVREPRGAAPPTRQQLASLAARLAETIKDGPSKPQPAVVALSDDWRTEGNWLGRYGKFWIDLDGAWARHGAHRYGLLWGYGTPWVQFRLRTALPFRDVVRAWIGTASAANRNSLELPLPFAGLQSANGERFSATPRRQSENDDHGEVYNPLSQGPGLLFTLTVPRGWSVLSFYEFNDDGHVGNGTPRRDYRVAVSSHPYSLRGLIQRSGFRETGGIRTRVVNFAGGGVWKRVMVRGPADVSIRITRNHSFNTILNAVALDWAAEKSPPYFESPGQWWRSRKYRRAWVAEEAVAAKHGYYSMRSLAQATTSDLCGDVANLLLLQRDLDPAEWAGFSSGGYCMLERCLTARHTSSSHRNSLSMVCNYRLCRFQHYESDLARLGLPIPREIEQKLRWKGRFRVFRNGGYTQLAQMAVDGAIEGKYTHRITKGVPQ